MHTVSALEQLLFPARRRSQANAACLTRRHMQTKEQRSKEDSSTLEYVGLNSPVVSP